MFNKKKMIKIENLEGSPISGITTSDVVLEALIEYREKMAKGEADDTTAFTKWSLLTVAIAEVRVPIG